MNGQHFMVGSGFLMTLNHPFSLGQWPFKKREPAGFISRELGSPSVSELGWVTVQGPSQCELSLSVGEALVHLPLLSETVTKERRLGYPPPRKLDL